MFSGAGRQWITMSKEKLRFSPEDRAFFKRFGERLSALRKDRGMTQVQLAKVLCCSQQRIVSFEKGIRRMPLSELRLVADALDVSFEDLLGTPGRPGKRGPASKLERQLETVAKLPRSQQRFVSRWLDAVIQQAQP